jgi:hypothetical protein
MRFRVGRLKDRLYTEKIIRREKISRTRLDDLRCSQLRKKGKMRSIGLYRSFLCLDWTSSELRGITMEVLY